MRLGSKTGFLWLLLLASGCVTSGAPPEVTEDHEEHKAMIRTPAAAAGAPAAAIARAVEKSCGATYTLTEGNRSGTDEFVVSVYPEAGRRVDRAGLPTAAVLQAFIDRNLALLSVDGHAVSAWCESEGGDCHAAGQTPACHLAVARIVKTLSEAQRLAWACNRRTIAWLRYDGVRLLDNGGKGYGDGKSLAGQALDVCRKARGD